MSVDRLSVTLEAELGAAVRDAAARAGMSVSAWLASAAEAHLRHQRLGVALDAWEADAGALSDEDLDAAAAKLGVSR
jgi:hypothetical protein